RRDYLPFGEEIWSGVGSRTTTQKYSVTDQERQRFAMTERDEVTGLDHTSFRKYESFAGRWTSPDPLSGNIGDPQSFNQYSYATNDPVNLVDPTGMMPCVPGDISPQCDSSGVTWGWGDLGRRGIGPGLATILAREEAFDRSLRSQSRYYSRLFDGAPPPWASSFIGSPFDGYNRVPLSGSALEDYIARRDRLLQLLNDPNSSCAKYLKNVVGVSGSRVARTVRAQRPFDGTKSTLTLAEAGILGPGSSAEIEGVNISSSDTVSSFFNHPLASAVHAGAARASTGATLRDVYYSPGSTEEYTILHEALHTLLGAKDSELNARGADVNSLMKAGCNSTGTAI